MSNWKDVAKDRGFNAGYALAMGWEVDPDHRRSSLELALRVGAQGGEAFSRPKAEAIYDTTRERYASGMGLS